MSFNPGFGVDLSRLLNMAEEQPVSQEVVDRSFDTTELVILNTIAHYVIEDNYGMAKAAAQRLEKWRAIRVDVVASHARRPMTPKELNSLAQALMNFDRGDLPPTLWDRLTGEH